MADRLPSHPVTVGMGHQANIISVNVPAANPLLPLVTQGQSVSSPTVLAAVPATPTSTLFQHAGVAVSAPTVGTNFQTAGSRATVVSSGPTVLQGGHNVSAFAMYSPLGQRPALPIPTQSGIVAPVQTSVVQLTSFGQAADAGHHHHQQQQQQQHVYLHHQGQASGVQQQAPVTTTIVAQPNALAVSPSASTSAGSQLASPSAGADPSAQSLKVEDALSYLDRVKMRFSENQAVYNDFLDTMRDFKAATIDTQEVINRVKTYFFGHPDLVLGFNAFLPAGYKMKASSDNQTISLLQPNRPPVTLVGPSASQSKPTAEQASSTDSNYPGGSDQYEEFNHAISYVNKIKSRFAGKSPVYKQFLEILHKYQKDQRSGEAHNTEEQVLGEVRQLFVGQQDLLDEFSQFLPQSATAQVTQQLREHSTASAPTAVKVSVSAVPQSASVASTTPAAPTSTTATATSTAPSAPTVGKRARPSTGESEVAKKPRVQRPIDRPTPLLSPTAPATGAQVPTPKEFAFFDKLKASLTDKDVHDNFMRTLQLFNTGKVGKTDFLNNVSRFLRPFPQLMKWLRDALQSDIPLVPDSRSLGQDADQQPTRQHLDIDFNTLNRCGSSYRMLPASYTTPKCSGRDQLSHCQEVLNDTLVSFPSWASEDTQFVSMKKSNYEEVCYRVEDERYELDMVLEVNNSTIRALESVQKRLQRMGTTDEQGRLKLGDDLGGSSAVLQRKAIQRIYGDKASSIIQGLQENPAVAVPLVLRRLKAKADEWREAQKAFNKLWREQIEKNYLKSLDLQSQNFKQSDVRQLRSRALINDIATHKDPAIGLTFPTDADVRKDAVDLLIHHVKRQNFVQEEKFAMKKLLRCWLRHLLMEEKLPLSDDELGDSSDQEEPASGFEEYRRLLFANNTVFVFLRLFHVICERLAGVKAACKRLAAGGESKDAESTAVALRLRQPTQLKPGQHYDHFIQLLLSLLDGALESSAFEDQVRELIGVRHYYVFTLERVVAFAVRQLHNLVTDDASKRLLRLQVKAAGDRANAKTASQPALEESYRRKAERLLPDSQSEHLYRLSCEPTDDAQSVIMTVRLLGSPAQQREEANGEQEKVAAIRQWSHYFELYKESEAGGGGKDATRQVFLVRNVLQWIRLTQRRRRQASTVAVAADDNASSDSSYPTCQGVLEKQWQRDTRSLLRTTFGFEASAEELFRDVTYWDQMEIRGVSERVCLLMYATGCESLFYRAGRLAKARESHRRLSWRKGSKLSDWLAAGASGIGEAERQACRSWLLGDTEDIRAGLRTTRVVVGPGETGAPYHAYNRYRTIVVKREADRQRPAFEEAAAAATASETATTITEVEEKMEVAEVANVDEIGKEDGKKAEEEPLEMSEAATAASASPAEQAVESSEQQEQQQQQQPEDLEAPESTDTKPEQSEQQQQLTD